MWNIHHIRASRSDTLKGKPDELYFLPELVGKSCIMYLAEPEEVGQGCLHS